MKKPVRKMSLVSRGAMASVLLTLAHSSVSTAAVSSVTDTSCNSRLDVTVASTTRSSAVSASDCQIRTLTASNGFEVNTNAPAGATTPDSSGMVSAGDGLYEAFVGGAREAAVLLTTNRALMMSRSITGDSTGVDWNLGLAVQPVSGATNAWLTGTYTLLRANREVRVVDKTNQTNAALSEVFDPVTLRITFNGNSGCSISSYSSWFSYSLTTDPAGAFSQPDGDDYGLHQVVYAGQGYSGPPGGVHEDSVRTFTDCDYLLSSDGKLLITYDYTDGDAVAHSVENSYFVSADLRYLVSTVDAGSGLYRGFEVGVRVKAISGTQDERNDGVAGTYLFNAPTLELQGSTGVLSEPDNENRKAEKATQCMSRGSTVLSTSASATSGWNTCTWDMSSTCSARGEEGEAPAIALAHITADGVNTASSCRFQVSADGSVNFVVNAETAEGAQDITYSGAVADNNEGLILRGKYVGSTMQNPSDTNLPERLIKNALSLQAVVGIKYSGTLTADADSDGLDNLGEFLYANYVAGSMIAENDFDNDGTADLLIRSSSAGDWRLFRMSGGVATSNGAYSAYTSSAWQLVASEDFDADGDTDILVRNTSTGAWRIFITENGVVQSDANFGAYANIAWEVASVADYNADGTKDVLLHSNSGGGWSVFYVSNGAVSSSANMALYASGWDLKYDGDIDGDGDADIILRRASDGYWRQFTVQGGVVASNSATGLYQSLSWTIQFASDLDNDGDDDIVMRSGTGNNWRTFAVSSGAVGANSKLSMYENASWTFNHLNDADADGDPDIVLRSNTGGWRMFLTDGLDTPANSAIGLYASSAWVKADVVDVDGDGTKDVILNNTSSGAWRAFMISGGVVASDTNPGLYQNTAWSIQNK